MDVMVGLGAHCLLEDVTLNGGGATRGSYFFSNSSNLELFFKCHSMDLIWS